MNTEKKILIGTLITLLTGILLGVAGVAYAREAFPWVDNGQSMITKAVVIKGPWGNTNCVLMTMLSSNSRPAAITCDWN